MKFNAAYAHYKLVGSQRNKKTINIRPLFRFVVI